MPKNSHAKARALRIPLLRSNSSDRLARYRNALTLAAVLGCIAWLVAGYYPNKKSALNRYSPGPVSIVHAQLGCQDCHQGSAPMRDATFLSRLKKTVDGNGTKLWHRESDVMCTKCHHVLGENETAADFVGKPVPVSPHSSNQLNESVDSCASCHLEHRGTDVLPSHVTDSSCVTCHARLENFRNSLDTGITSKISSFEKDHPPFRSLERDRGVLKFNHKLHLAAGLVDESAPKITSKNPSDYDDPEKLLSRFENAAGEIKLDCNFCHQPTNEPATVTKFASNNLGLSKIGKFMSMPTYEQNCRVCHPLQLEPNLAFDKKLEIPHGDSPEQVLRILNVYFSMAAAPVEIKQQLPKGDFDPPITIPTRLGNPNVQPVPDSIRDLVDKAANTVRTACLRCHFASRHDEGQGVLLARTILDVPGTESMFDSVVLKHGKFDHAAHRDVACKACHDYENNLGKSQMLNIEVDKPMIRDRDICLACHRSAANVSPPNRAGPTDCISCHTYHGGGSRQ